MTIKFRASSYSSIAMLLISYQETKNNSSSITHTEIKLLSALLKHLKSVVSSFQKEDGQYMDSLLVVS